MSRTQRSVIRFVVSLQIYHWMLFVNAMGWTRRLGPFEGDVWDAWDGIGSA